MFFDKKKETLKVDEPDGFGYTSKYITDELELIQDQRKISSGLVMSLRRRFQTPTR